MTTRKIAITVPERVLVRARAAVRRGGARSLSAYVSAAIDQKAMLDDLDAMLEEMLAATGGPLTTAEREQAREDLLGPSSGRARSGRARTGGRRTGGGGRPSAK